MYEGRAREEFFKLKFKSTTNSSSENVLDRGISSCLFKSLNAIENRRGGERGRRPERGEKLGSTCSKNKIEMNMK